MNSSPGANLKTTGLSDEEAGDSSNEEARVTLDQGIQMIPGDLYKAAHKTIDPEKAVPAKKAKSTKRKRSQPVEDLNAPFVPKRDYYHSTSFIKFKDNEWENDVDSDDEVDHSWRRRLEKSELHEFTDIPTIEKEFMQMWNAFVRSDTVIRAKSIPQKCLDFIEKNAVNIKEAGLGEQLPWHLVNLWDEGLISSDHLSFCLDHYRSLASGAHTIDEG